MKFANYTTTSSIEFIFIVCEQIWTGWNNVRPSEGVQWCHDGLDWNGGQFTSIFVAILGHIGLPQSGNVAACVLGPNNNKAIIRFYPYDDHQDRGACQIWKVILESRHCVYLTTLQLLIFTLAQTISNSNSNIHEQLSAIKRIKINWTLKSFPYYLIFY